MKIEELNNANKIIIDNFLARIVINKKNHKIAQTRQVERKVYRDKTKKCEKMENEYMLTCEYVAEAYSFGVVCSKILNNRTDERCMELLNKSGSRITIKQ